MPVKIKVRDGNVAKSMMQLKRTLIREGLFKELKKRKYYIKPSVAKRLKREAAEKQRNKDLKRELRAAQKADFWIKTGARLRAPTKMDKEIP